MRSCLSLLAALLLVACSSGQTLSTSSGARVVSPVATAIAETSSAVLVFEADSPPNYRFTLTSADGTILRTADTAAGTGSVWQGDSSALLLYGPANQTHAVLSRDGTVSEFPGSLNAAFDTRTADAIGTGAGDPILLDNGTALGLSGYANPLYELIDVRTGVVDILLKTAATGPTPGIGRPSTAIPLGTSTDRRVARLIVRHCTANGTAVPEWAMVEIDVPSKAVTSITQLPTPTGLDPWDILEPAVSSNGRFLAYQENLKADSNNTAIYRTHIVDLVTGKDMPLADTSIEGVGNSRALRFSPDGTTLLLYGISAPQVFPQHSRLTVFATSDGHVTQNFDVGDSLHNLIQPVGWIDGHELVYTTTTTTLLGNFTNGNEDGYVLDLASGSQLDLPTGLGRLVAVLV
jgi:hypothetical protein